MSNKPMNATKKQSQGGAGNGYDGVAAANTASVENIAAMRRAGTENYDVAGAIERIRALTPTNSVTSNSSQSKRNALNNNVSAAEYNNNLLPPNRSEQASRSHLREFNVLYAQIEQLVIQTQLAIKSELITKLNASAIAARAQARQGANTNADSEVSKTESQFGRETPHVFKLSPPANRMKNNAAAVASTPQLLLSNASSIKGDKTPDTVTPPTRKYAQQGIYKLTTSQSKGMVHEINPNMSENEVVVNSASLEDVVNSEMSNNHAHSIQSLNSALDTPTPDDNFSCEDLQDRLETSTRNIQQLQEEHKKLLQLHGMAKRNLSEMEAIGLAGGSKGLGLNRDSTPPQYNTVDDVKNDVNTLTKRMATITELMKRQDQLSSLLDERSSEIIAERDALEKKISGLRTQRDDLVDLVEQLTEANLHCEQSVKEAKNFHDNEKDVESLNMYTSGEEPQETYAEARKGRQDMQPRVVPIKLLQQTQKEHQQKQQQAQKQLAEAHGNRESDDGDDTNIERLKEHLTRLKNMMQTLNNIETEAGVNGTNATLPPNVRADYTRRSISQSSSAYNPDRERTPVASTAETAGCSAQSADFNASNGYLNKYQRIDRLTDNLRNQANTMHNEGERIKALKEDCELRTKQAAAAVQMGEDALKRSSLTPTPTPMPQRQQMLPNTSEEYEELRQEYEHRKQEFKRLCRELEDNDARESVAHAKKIMETFLTNSDDDENAERATNAETSSVACRKPVNRKHSNATMYSIDSVDNSRSVKSNEQASARSNDNESDKRRLLDSMQRMCEIQQQRSSATTNNVTQQNEHYGAASAAATPYTANSVANNMKHGGDVPQQEEEDHGGNVSIGTFDISSSAQSVDSSPSHHMPAPMAYNNWHMPSPMTTHLLNSQILNAHANAAQGANMVSMIPSVKPTTTAQMMQQHHECLSSMLQSTTAQAGGGGPTLSSTPLPQQHSNGSDSILMQQFTQMQQMLINTVFQNAQLIWQHQREIESLQNTIRTLQDRLQALAGNTPNNTNNNNSTTDMQFNMRAESVPPATNNSSVYNANQSNMHTFVGYANNSRAQSEQPFAYTTAAVGSPIAVLMPTPPTFPASPYFVPLVGQPAAAMPPQSLPNAANYRLHTLQQQTLQHVMHQNQYLQQRTTAMPQNSANEHNAEQQQQSVTSSTNLHLNTLNNASVAAVPPAAGATNGAQQAAAPAPILFNNELPQSLLVSGGSNAGSCASGGTAGPGPIFMHHHNNAIHQNNANLRTQNQQQQQQYNNNIASNVSSSSNTTIAGSATANAAQLNNQVPPGNRANNYWDNFRSYSRQNLLSSNSNKSNEDYHQQQLHMHTAHAAAAAAAAGSDCSRSSFRLSPSNATADAAQQQQQQQQQHQQQQQLLTAMNLESAAMHNEAGIATSNLRATTNSLGQRHTDSNVNANNDAYENSLPPASATYDGGTSTLFPSTIDDLPASPASPPPSETHAESLNAEQAALNANAINMNLNFGNSPLYQRNKLRTKFPANLGENKIIDEQPAATQIEQPTDGENVQHQVGTVVFTDDTSMSNYNGSAENLQDVMSDQWQRFYQQHRSLSRFQRIQHAEPNDFGNVTTTDITDNVAGSSGLQTDYKSALKNHSMSEQVKRNLLVNALKNDKFTNKVYESIKEDVFRRLEDSIFNKQRIEAQTLKYLKQLALSKEKKSDTPATEAAASTAVGTQLPDTAGSLNDELHQHIDNSLMAHLSNTDASAELEEMLRVSSSSSASTTSSTLSLSERNAMQLLMEIDEIDIPPKDLRLRLLHCYHKDRILAMHFNPANRTDAVIASTSNAAAVLKAAAIVGGIKSAKSRKKTNTNLNELRVQDKCNNIINNNLATQQAETTDEASDDELSLQGAASLMAQAQLGRYKKIYAKNDTNRWQMDQPGDTDEVIRSIIWLLRLIHPHSTVVDDSILKDVACVTAETARNPEFSKEPVQLDEKQIIADIKAVTTSPIIVEHFLCWYPEFLKKLFENASADNADANKTFDIGDQDVEAAPEQHNTAEVAEHSDANETLMQSNVEQHNNEQTVVASKRSKVQGARSAASDVARKPTPATPKALSATPKSLSVLTVAVLETAARKQEMANTGTATTTSAAKRKTENESQPTPTISAKPAIRIDTTVPQPSIPSKDLQETSSANAKTAPAAESVEKSQQATDAAAMKKPAGTHFKSSNTVLNISKASKVPTDAAATIAAKAVIAFANQRPKQPQSNSENKNSSPTATTPPQQHQQQQQQQPGAKNTNLANKKNKSQKQNTARKQHKRNGGRNNQNNKNNNSGGGNSTR